jgi:AcrR family transcriptional regulator
MTTEANSTPSAPATSRRRGPYANGQQRREEFVTKALEVFATQGLKRLSMRKIAEALGVSHATLSYYFASREELLQAVFDAHDDQEQILASDRLAELGLLDALPELGRYIEGIPRLIQLDLSIEVEGIGVDNAAHNYARQRVGNFMEAVRRELERERDRGRLRPDLDLDVTTRHLTALVRGLQLQWLYDPDIALDSHLEAFASLLRR